jgi:hypothetical protein
LKGAGNWPRAISWRTAVSQSPTRLQTSEKRKARKDAVVATGISYGKRTFRYACYECGCGEFIIIWPMVVGIAPDHTSCCLMGNTPTAPLQPGMRGLSLSIVD